MLILGIESSCDETAAAVLSDGMDLLSNVINSQIEIHSLYGGVVPELASRQHVRNIYPVVRLALKEAGKTIEDIDGIAVTEGPGLVGCLLVAHTFAKALSLAGNIPMVGVDHITGHLLSVFLGDKKPEFPYVAMAASGGHSSLFLVNKHNDLRLLGRTRDDAAGEAFDKVAKLLDLGYPGGPIIGEIAEGGNPAAIQFPRAWLGPKDLDFSFSGLKTSVANYLNKTKQNNIQINKADVCASFQEAIIDVITEKSVKACQLTECPRLVLAGGVAANHRLRERLAERCEEEDLALYLTPPAFCTDNAAMIALAGYYDFNDRSTLTPKSDVYSRSPVL